MGDSGKCWACSFLCRNEQVQLYGTSHSCNCIPLSASPQLKCHYLFVLGLSSLVCSDVFVKEGIDTLQCSGMLSVPYVEEHYSVPSLCKGQ